MIINIINLSPSQPLGTYLNGQDDLVIKNRIDRALSIVEQSKKFGFAIRFWPGNYDDPKKRCTNISRAFKQIVRWAKDQNMPHVCIAEDDMLFTSPNAWKYYLENIPKDYDLYLGGIYNGELFEKTRIVNGYSGNTLVTVHERFYDFFLKADENMDLDNYLGMFAFEKRYIVCYPFVVKQIGHWSDHKKAINTLALHYAKIKEKGWEFYEL